jgi:hypothetical protein
MSYTLKELTEKYENLWEQVDGVYKESSYLKECIEEFDSKYDTIWGKVASLNELSKDIDTKYDLIWNKCNTNSAEILKLKEYNIGNPQFEIINSDIQEIKSKYRVLDEEKLTQFRRDIFALQGRVKHIEKIEDDHIGLVTNISHDMYVIRCNNNTLKKYIDEKFGNLCVVIQIVICIIIIMCLYLLYVVKLYVVK